MNPLACVCPMRGAELMAHGARVRTIEVRSSRVVEMTLVAGLGGMRAVGGTTTALN